MNATEALTHIKTVVLRRERNRDIKNHVMSLALIGPISEEDITQVAERLRVEGYVITLENQQGGFPGTGHMRID